MTAAPAALELVRHIRWPEGHSTIAREVDLDQDVHGLEP
jgi:hypothetical protein